MINETPCLFSSQPSETSRVWPRLWTQTRGFPVYWGLRRRCFSKIRFRNFPEYFPLLSISSHRVSPAARGQLEPCIGRSFLWAAALWASLWPDSRGHNKCGWMSWWAWFLVVRSKSVCGEFNGSPQRGIRPSQHIWIKETCVQVSFCLCSLLSFSMIGLWKEKRATGHWSQLFIAAVREYKM